MEVDHQRRWFAGIAIVAVDPGPYRAVLGRDMDLRYPDAGSHPAEQQPSQRLRKLSTQAGQVPWRRWIGTGQSPDKTDQQARSAVHDLVGQSTCKTTTVRPGICNVEPASIFSIGSSPSTPV